MRRLDSETLLKQALIELKAAEAFKAQAQSDIDASRFLFEQEEPARRSAIEIGLPEEIAIEISRTMLLKSMKYSDWATLSLDSMDRHTRRFQRLMRAHNRARRREDKKK